MPSSVQDLRLSRATGSVLKFPGFRSVYLEGRDDTAGDSGRQPLPELAAGETP